jgi:hypothetical protein
LQRSWRRSSMDEAEGLPEDRFKALLGRTVKREDRERLSKLRMALRISPNDAVWDVMIALDYHLQLYNAVPKEIAREADKAVVELRGLVDAVRARERGGHGGIAEGAVSAAVISPATVAVAGASAIAFGGLCIAAGYLMSGRGRPPWGAQGPMGALLGAPAGWLVFVLLLPGAVKGVRAGWATTRSHQDLRVRAVGFALLVLSVGLIAAGLAVLALALRR